jgi:hypothetical protein
MPFWRRKNEPEPIDEQQAYERSYGAPREDVRRVHLPPRRPRDEDVLRTGEKLRRAFLDKLEERDADKEPPA